MRWLTAAWVRPSSLAVFGGEAILVDGSAVVQSTSGNFGYSVGKSLVLAYLPNELLGQAAIAVEAFGERSAASVIREQLTIRSGGRSSARR